MSRPANSQPREILQTLLDQLSDLDNRIIRLERSTRQFRQELSATHPNWHVVPASKMSVSGEPRAVETTPAV